MHDTALELGKTFFDTHLANQQGLKILDVGSYDMNGTLRSVVPSGHTYVGTDIESGPGVDIVMEDPYNLPFSDNEFDITLSTSCFEHAEFFWLSFNEMLRVTKSSGLIYINAPSNGVVHRHPVDCWRFYPDSGIALQNWGRRSGYDVTLLETLNGRLSRDGWIDCVSVFRKALPN